MFTLLSTATFLFFLTFKSKQKQDKLGLCSIFVLTEPGSSSKASVRAVAVRATAVDLCALARRSLIRSENRTRPVCHATGVLQYKEEANSHRSMGILLFIVSSSTVYFSFIKTNFGAHKDPSGIHCGSFGNIQAHRAALALQRGGQSVIKMTVVNQGVKRRGGKEMER